MFKKINEKKVLVPAILTMLTEDQDFNESAQRALVRWLISKGVDGFYVGGSTGEGPILSMDIRRRLIQTVIDETNGQLPVIAYIGFADTKQSIELAQFAQDSGADGISAVPPYYYKHNFSSIYTYYKDIAENTSLPIIIYYMQSGQTISNDELKKLADIKNVYGLKFTGSDHYVMQQVKLTMSGKYVFSGRDEQCLSALFMGADGLIGSTYNVLPEIYGNIINSYTNGSLKSAENQAYAANLALSKLLEDGLYLGSIKKLLRYAGIDSPTIRKPMMSPTSEQFEDLCICLAKLKNLPEFSDSEIIQNI